MDNSKLITVTYAGDLAHLYYHALSLKKFWTGTPRWTIVAEDGEYTKTWCQTYILPLLPSWNIDVLLPPPLAATDGWHRQQFLKLWSAAEAIEDWVIILDAKNILIKDLDESSFFLKDKVLMQVFDKDRLYSNEHIDSCKLLNLSPNRWEVFCITPFVWKSSIVRTVIERLKDNEYDIYKEPVMVGSEASAYWAVAQTVVPWQAAPANAQGQYGGITLETRLSDAELFEIIKDIPLASNIKFFTLHRFHTTPANLLFINKFLEDLGIIDTYNANMFNTIFVNHISTLRPEVQEFLRIDWNERNLTERDSN